MGLPGAQRDVEKLVDDHYLGLYRYAFRLTGSPGDAEDLTQETFCKAQVKLHQLADAGKAKSWLFKILRNTYLHRVRSDIKRIALGRNLRGGQRRQIHNRHRIARK